MLKINIEKARQISHKLRRADRTNKMAPLDQQISTAIPGIDPVLLEKQREVIRVENAKMQVSLESAASPEELKQVLISYGVV